MSQQRSETSPNHQRPWQAQGGQDDRSPSPAYSYHHACFEAALDAMLIADDRGCYVDANPAACELFGLPKAALLGRCIADFAQVEFDFDQAWQAFLAQGQERGEFSLVRPDGTVREVEYAATANVLPHHHLSILRDITDRKQLERHVQQLNQVLEQQVSQRTAELQQTNWVLRTTNQRLAAEIHQRERAEIALACAGDGLWDWNTETHEVYFSPSWKILLGYADSEIGNTFDEWERRVHPDDRDRVEAALQEHFSGQTPIYQSEHRLLAKDGTWRWILDRGKVVTWKPDGTPLRVIGTHVDITERKQLEAALQASQQKYQALFAILPVGVSITDSEGKLIESNPASEGILGISVTEQTQRTDDAPIWQIVDTHGNPLAPADYASVRALREQRVIHGQEQGILRPDGSLCWVTVSAAPLPLPGYGVVIAYHDITQRKQLEHSLQASEARFRAVFEQAKLGIGLVTLEGRFFQVNPGLCDFLGYTEAELTTLSYQQITHPDDLALNLSYTEKIVTGELTSYSLEKRYVRKDGQICWVNLLASSILDEQGNLQYFVKITTDITDRKAAERQLLQREAELRALAENTPDYIVRCDRQFRYLYANPAVARLNQLSTTAILGKTAQDLGWPEPLVHAWHQQVAQVFNRGQTCTLEATLPLPTGGDLTLDARIVPEFDAQGEVASVLVVARDITPLKQAQLALLQQAERERILRTITAHLRQTLDFSRILATAVTEVQQTLQADRTLIFQLTSDHAGVVIQEAVRPEYPVTLAMRWEDECFPPECYAYYCQGKARIVSDVALDTWGACLAEFMQQTGVQSKMVAPIVQHQDEGALKVWGLLITHACAEPRRWQPSELDLLAQVATQLAIALQQSELHQQIQQWAMTLEQQVQERTAEIQQALDREAMLQRIIERVRNSLDEEQILETVVQELGQVLDLECCDTGIYNADRTTSTIAHEFTRSGTTAKGTTFAIVNTTHDFVYSALWQGQAVQFCDLAPCPFRTQYRELTVLAYPIQDEQQIWGDLWLYKQGIFLPAEIRLVEQISNQCAIALRQSRLYQAAQAQVIELERLNRLKDDFLSTVSHELRTPMANIKMATEMLEIRLKQLGILSDELTPVRRYFQILKEESQREIRLINDLLDLTRLDAGIETLDLTTVDLYWYLPQLAEPFAERTRRQHQALLFQIPSDLPPLTTDFSLLDRILSELLHNACKYTPPQGTITLSAQATSDALIIQVTNSGVEIPATERDRIFDRFYRIPNTDPWKHGGTGLGLALVKKLVERLGATIQVESANSQTSFILIFP